ITADLELTPGEPSLETPERFWIPELAWRFRFFWQQQNWCGRSLCQKARKQGWLQHQYAQPSTHIKKLPVHPPGRHTPFPELVEQRIGQPHRAAVPQAGVLPVGYRIPDFLRRQPAFGATASNDQVNARGFRICPQLCQGLLADIRGWMEQVNGAIVRTIRQATHSGNKRRNTNTGPYPDLGAAIIFKIKAAIGPLQRNRHTLADPAAGPAGVIPQLLDHKLQAPGFRVPV